jgi:hypothetical protein
MGQMLGNMGNPNVTNPQQAQWGDMDPSEKGARVLAGGTKGLAQGFSNYQQQNSALRQGGGGGAQIPMGGQPQVDPAYFQPQMRRPNNLNFYGGQ